jgi:urease accessory protein
MAEFSGHLKLRAEARENGRTVLAGQSFRAPFHVGKAYWDEEGAALRVQVVNPTAGILEGDRLETEIAVGARAALLVTTPSASRVFHMRSGEAVASQKFSVEAGGWLEFLPEPLVPHNASSFRQTTEIDVAEGGEIAFADLLMPGRIARGETWAWSRLRLELVVRVGEELILRERLDQSGEEMRALAKLAGVGERKSEAGRLKGESGAGGDGIFNREWTRMDANGGAEEGAVACCFGNVVIVSRALEDGRAWRERIEALHGARAWVGVSALRGARGGWSLKIVAADGAELRRVLSEAREILAEKLPRMRAELRRV